MEAPDRAQGHGAAVFSHSTGVGEGRLDIQWAVFLPLGENRTPPIRCQGNTVFRLTLHGHFFIDAGRVSVEGLADELWETDGDPTNESDLRKKWNRLLAQQGTLPLIIPGLETFVGKTRISADKVWNLCQALGQSQLFTRYKKYICSKHSWVCLLTPKGRLWESVASGKNILTLPAPPQTAPSRPWDVFPHLDELTREGSVLLLEEAPHLHLLVRMPRSSQESSQRKVLAQWSETALLKILNLEEKIVFADQGKLDYLLKFLLSDSVHTLLNYGSVQGRLKAIAVEASIQLRNELNQNRSKFQEFVGTIHSKRRYQLKAGNHRIIRELQGCKVEHLIIAKEYDYPKSPGDAKLSIEDSLALLKKLDELIAAYEAQDDSKNCDHAREVAGEILQRLENEARQTVLNRSINLKILAGYDCLRKKEVSLSVHELEQCRNAGLLFRNSQGTTSADWYRLGPKLQAVLKHRVLLINRATADLVFGEEASTVQPCNANAVLSSLGNTMHQIRKTGDRIDLIKGMAAADLSLTERVRGLRYLLHGNENLYDYDGTLWISGYEQSLAWRKIWHQLGQEASEHILDRSIVEELSSKKWSQLAIKEIKPQGIIDELRLSGTEPINGEVFSRDERDDILRELDGDEQLWKALPFHETLRGELVKIEQETYLESDIALTGELSNLEHIIKRSTDSHVARQQRDWLPPLSPVAVVAVALKQHEPARFWQQIMDSLNEQTISHHQEKLKTVQWILDNDNTSVSPGDVIKLDAIQDDVDRLIAAIEGVYSSPKNLHQDIRNHPSFELLALHCFAQDREGIENMSIFLAEIKEYHIGKIHIDEHDIQTIANICAHLPVECRLPGWRLIDNVISAYSTEETFLLFKEIQKPVSLDKIRKALSWLQRTHESSDSENAQHIIKAYNGYLDAMAQMSGAQEILANIKLLNKEGRWKASSKLCAKAESAAGSHLLDEEQQQILHKAITLADKQKAKAGDNHPQRRDLEPEIRATAYNLDIFFADWEGLVPPEIICAFLSLLGDDPDLLALAEKYRGRRHLKWIRDNIPWAVHQRVDSSGRREWLYGLNKHQALAQHRFIVRYSDGETVNVCSILGEEIEVPLQTSFTSLLSGGLYYELSNKAEIIPVRITLRKPNLDEASPSELIEYLRATSEYLLKKAYNQKEFSLASLWDELGKSEQLDIRIAQQLVLSHVPFYLRQLGVHKHAKLKELLDKWNDARYKRQEYYESDDKKFVYEKRQRDSLFEIQELLRGDAGVQRAVLEAVRAKMRDYQYTVTSIPFELFQNADDAVVELAQIHTYPTHPEESDEDLPGHIKRFVVVQDEDALVFLHWGRPINAIGTAGFPGKERGFHQDLEKMLVLSSSDKPAEGAVTGKFGLGFKSVLLACDRPQLVSGQLATEIIGGLCPSPISDSNRLRSRFKGYQDDRRWPGTLIELPIKKESQVDITASFSQLSGIMTIFSQQIRKIEIVGEVKKEWQWLPVVTELSQGRKIEFGILPWQERHTNHLSAIYLRLPDGGVLFSVGPEGFRPLPDMPAIWVVAPTKEIDGLGFALNCGFELDAGRERLSGSSAFNRDKASRLGLSLGKALVDIASMVSGNWEELKQEFYLKSDLSRYDFWSSLWTTLKPGVLSRGNDNVRSIMVNMFCENQGLGYLAQKVPVLPNGLWKEYRCLTRPESIRTVLKGCLVKEGFFNGLTGWDFFKLVLGDAESVIAYDEFTLAKRVIPKLGEVTNQWKTLEIADILRRFINEEIQILPSDAKALGIVFNSKRMKHKDLEQEQEELEYLFHKIRFKAKDGAFYSSELLISDKKHELANPDESRRAGFAPSHYVLSEGYQETALDFFFVCREKIGIEIKTMADWLFQAESDAQRASGLRYIMEGEHGEKVATLVRKKGIVGTWLADLQPSSTYFKGWDKEEVLELLLRKLPSLDDLRREHEDSEWEMPFSGKLTGYGSTEDILNAIYEWWNSHQVDHLQEYENSVYPRNIQLNLEEDEAGRIDRESWLTLFCLAHFQTMGRQRDLQHRGFIETCINRGWWSTFARSKPENRSDEWMNILEEYIGEQVDSSDFEVWMNRFPVIYKFSRWLDEYYEAFLSINRMEKISSLSLILSTRASDTYQGGGLSAPPIEKSLSLGACFVIRELKRKSVLNGNQVDRYCFLPNGRMRELFEGLGCRGLEVGHHAENSKTIHQFLCKYLGEERAKFSGAYDVPLQIFTENQDVRSSIL